MALEIGKGSMDGAKVCFLQLGLSAFIPHFGGVSGGAERQAWSLAMVLKDRMDMASVVYDVGQRKIEIADDMVFIKGPPPPTKVGEINPLNLTRYISALELADADIYLQKGLDLYTSPAISVVKNMKRRFVISISHDFEVTLNGIGGVRRALYRSALSKAHAVIAQTQWQARSLKGMAKDVHVIPPIIPVDLWRFCQGDRGATQDGVGGEGEVRVVWIGHARPWKRAELFLSVIKSLFDMGVEGVRAIMVLVPGLERAYFMDIKAKAQKITSALKKKWRFEFHEGLGRREIISLLGPDTILVNTSVAEGFPNTFLEAWATRTPVASLKVDPDGLLQSRGCGLWANGSIEDLAEGLKHMVEDPNYRRAMGERGWRYVMENSHPERVKERYLALFERLI